MENGEKLGFFAKPEDAKNLQPLVLALVGDAVESLYLRKYFATTSDIKVNLITKKINAIVNAKSQAEAFKLIESELTEDEQDVARHARNTHTHSTAKNYSVIDYRHATALEAVLGYLYLSKNFDRLDYVLNKVTLQKTQK